MKLRLSLLLLLSIVNFSFAQVANPVSWSVKSTADKATFTAKIDQPWHMYDLGPYDGGPNPTAFTFELPEGVKLSGGVKQTTTPIIAYDKAFKMDIGTFADKAVFEQQFINTTGKVATIKGVVEWQVCNDSDCLSPEEYDFTFKIEPSTPEALAAAGQTDSTASTGADNAITTAAPVSTEVSDSVIKKEQSSIWEIILAAMGWGLLAILTPCVFPMVPMTVSFFLKNSGSKRKGRFLATTYGLSIITLYTLPVAAIILITYFLGGDAVTGSIFNWLATHWIPNILFFIIFLVFAISFFGAFEITMPSKLVNKSDSKSDKGGLIGTFFMALTLVLVSFSCTGPIVSSAIIGATKGEFWEPIITMLVFSTVFALPFTIFAFFPSLLKNVPKSGGWLNSVKVVLGFVELALGLKFLSVADQVYHWGLLDRETYLALWIVIFTLMGLYLLGKLRFKHDDEMKFLSVKRLFFAIATFSFVVYLIPGMWGAPLKALSGYLPPMHTLDFNLSDQKVASSSSEGTTLDLSKLKGGKPKYSDFLHLPHGLEGFYDYAEGLEYAKAVGKPVMIDFTGHGCVNCREMEANVWSDPAVLAMLSKKYVIIALYVDDKKTLPEDQWVIDEKGKLQKTIGKVNSAFQIKNYGVNAQPYYILMDPATEQMLVQPRAYNLDVSGFIQFLESGITEFNKRSASPAVTE